MKVHKSKRYWVGARLAGKIVEFHLNLVSRQSRPQSGFYRNNILTTIRWLAYLVGGAALFLALTLLVFSSVGSGGLAGQSPIVGLTPQAFLPFLHLSLPTPTPVNSDVEAVLQITPGGGLNASTFEPGSFILMNMPASSAQISQVTIDLRTAAFPDMVFDPFGLAGDQVAKDLTIDSDPALVGFLGHSFNSPHDDGFDVLILNFNDFDPGEQVTFSIDVDPTSIRGAAAPGPAESGSVSGLELSGAAITISFSNNLTLTGQMAHIPGSESGAITHVRQGLPPQPAAVVKNVPTPPATVTSAGQLIQLSGAPPWTTAVVLVIEGGLFTAGLPGGGYDIDPFEANSALQANEYRALVNDNGQANIPITLQRTNPNGGLNHILVFLEDVYGYTGSAAGPIVLELIPPTTH